MSRIELININKYYGDNHVLKDMTLTIEDGAFMTRLRQDHHAARHFRS